MSLNFTADANAHKLVPKHNRPQTSYQGPDVYTLDGQLLNSLNSYFEELGISNELVSFVQEFSTNSEHPLLRRVDTRPQELRRLTDRIVPNHLYPHHLYSHHSL